MTKIQSFIMCTFLKAEVTTISHGDHAKVRGWLSMLQITRMFVPFLITSMAIVCIELTAADTAVFQFSLRMNSFAQLCIEVLQNSSLLYCLLTFLLVPALNFVQLFFIDHQVLTSDYVLLDNLFTTMCNILYHVKLSCWETLILTFFIPIYYFVP